jgi:CheY-like chemotaxis protein
MAADSRPRVLLIDDDRAVREVVGDLLAVLGFQCHTAENGASGLVRFEQGNWDLVLTDFSMPGMNGCQVIEAIRERTHSVPIVLVTAGYMAPEDLQCAGKYGVPVLAKPFPIATLQAVVEGALRGKGFAIAT